MLKRSSVINLFNITYLIIVSLGRYLPNHPRLHQQFKGRRSLMLIREVFLMTNYSNLKSLRKVSDGN